MEMIADRINLNSRFNVNASRDIMFNGNRARIYENNNLNFNHGFNIKFNIVPNNFMNNDASSAQEILHLTNSAINCKRNLVLERALTIQNDDDILIGNGCSIKEEATTNDLLLWQGNTANNINFRVGTIGTTPEMVISDEAVNLLNHLDITHSTVSTSERVKLDNPVIVMD